MKQALVKRHRSLGVSVHTARTLPVLIRSIAIRYGTAVAIRTVNAGSQTRTLSFAELNRRSAELARALVASDVGKGSRIGLCYQNGPDFVVAMTAIARIGAIAIPIDPALQSTQLLPVLQHSDVCGLLIQDKTPGADPLTQLVDAVPALGDSASPMLRLTRLPYLRWAVIAGDSPYRAVTALEDFIARATTVSDQLLEALETAVHATDQMIELYTTGMQSAPEGVRHLHGQVLSQTHSLRRILKVTLGQEIVVREPMFAASGLVKYLLPCLEAGATALCRDLPSTHIKPFETAVHCSVRGRSSRMLLLSATLGPYGFVDGQRIYGDIVCARLRQVADGHEVRVADWQGRLVEDGEIGEIQVRGSSLTSGLHKVEHAACFTADGFFSTGTPALVEDSRIYIVDTADAEILAMNWAAR
jgi:acyl-CoA synthetase (AMP-forming)/AMP-acid ligase II